MTERFVFEKGVHTEKKRLEIKSIPATIVDSHNEALNLWMDTVISPALLLHIDKHDDMQEHAKTFARAKEDTEKYRIWLEGINSYEDYVKLWTNCSNFISVAVHEKKVDCVYWFDPRKNSFTAYGSIDNGIVLTGLKTFVEHDDQIIRWNTSNGSNLPPSREISLPYAQQDISKFKRPVILDIDLDAFLCASDPSRQRNDQTLSVALERLKKTENILGSIGHKPTAISIARSQTRNAYVPPAHVDKIQDLTLEMLNRVF